MADLNGGRAVVELLKAEGVRYIFGIVGSTFLDVLDALYDDRSVEYINVRHEQAAAFMADGLARVTDLPGVCLVTSGPGATNLLTGVAAAHVAHSPVVVLVGGVALDHYAEGRLPGVRPRLHVPAGDQARACRSTRPERIPELLRAALRAAMSGRRGPVLVEIPRDVLSEPLAAGRAAGARRRYRATHPLPPHPDAIREAAALLRQAERPLLLVGGGANRAGAGELVVRLSEQHGIPMITAYGRNDAVPNAHPLYVGPLGRAGVAGGGGGVPPRRPHPGRRLAPRPVHHALRRPLHPPGDPIVQIDVESARHRPLLSGGRRHPGRRARGVPGPARRARPRRRRPRREPAWRQEAEALRAQRQARLAGEAKLDAQPLKPQRVYAELRRVLPPDTIVALDAGAAPAYGYDRLQLQRGRARSSRRSTSAASASRFRSRSAPSSAGRTAPVVAIHGDGGYPHERPGARDRGAPRHQRR